MASKSKYNAYFLIENDVASCLFCNYSHPHKSTSSTTTLRNHLEKNHEVQYQNLLEKEQSQRKAVQSAAEKSKNNSIKRNLKEVEDYLSRPRDKSYANASGFWNDPINSSKYPRLKSLVYKYHSAPATSAESERLFSTAKLILTDLRKNLSAENFEKQLFLHHNLLILDGKMEENRIKKI